MSFSEQPPSKQWAALKYRGAKFAEVWFKPDGDPFVLTFRIPQDSFQISGMAEQLTMENLLRAVAVAPEIVESWGCEDFSHPGNEGSNPEFKNALPPPPGAHLEIRVHVRRPESGDSQRSDSSLPAASCPLPSDSLTPDVKWQDLENRWRAILTIEASMETLRIAMEGLLNEMDGLWKKPLSMEEKTYAPRADVDKWTKAKNRVHNALPKVKEFIHRAVWSMGSPERKRLEEIHDSHIQPRVPFPQMDELMKQLEDLRKDRQILAAQGKTVYQESKIISVELQSALRSLHANAASAFRKKTGTGPKGRHF